jgi:hypothetical protein
MKFKNYLPLILALSALTVGKPIFAQESNDERILLPSIETVLQEHKPSLDEGIRDVPLVPIFEPSCYNAAERFTLSCLNDIVGKYNEAPDNDQFNTMAGDTLNELLSRGIKVLSYDVSNQQDTAKFVNGDLVFSSARENQEEVSERLEVTKIETAKRLLQILSNSSETYVFDQASRNSAAKLLYLVASNNTDRSGTIRESGDGRKETINNTEITTMLDKALNIYTQKDDSSSRELTRELLKTYELMDGAAQSVFLGRALNSRDPEELKIVNGYFLGGNTENKDSRYDLSNLQRAGMHIRHAELDKLVDLITSPRKEGQEGDIIQAKAMRYATGLHQEIINGLPQNDNSERTARIRMMLMEPFKVFEQKLRDNLNTVYSNEAESMGLRRYAGRSLGNL